MNTAFLSLAKGTPLFFSFFFLVKGAFTVSPSRKCVFRVPMLNYAIPADIDSIWPYSSVP